MPSILCIETSTTVCSVALKTDSGLFFREVNEGFSHAEKLTVFITEVLKEAASNIKEIDAVAVSKGPGSYTGLRIGVSAAKGLCYAIDKPLISISTLEAMALAAIQNKNHSSPDLFCPMIDARRMEVYTALFDQQLNQVAPVEAIVIDDTFYSAQRNNHMIYFFGDGAGKCKEVLVHDNFIFLDGNFVSAKNMMQPAIKKYVEGDFENLALFEPFYLKEYKAGKSNLKDGK